MIELKNGHETDKFGIIRHYVDGDLHSINDEPAVIFPNGSQMWFKYNMIHRENGPAAIHIKDDGKHEEWYKEGKCHREDGPAAIRPHGNYWIENGVYHRLDGPAIELSDGGLEWYVDGHRHRVGEPAIISPDGSRYWYLNGHLHREDGPAFDVLSYKIGWYLDGQLIDVKTQKEFLASKELREWNLRAFL